MTEKSRWLCGTNLFAIQQMCKISQENLYVINWATVVFICVQLQQYFSVLLACLRQSEEHQLLLSMIYHLVTVIKVSACCMDLRLSQETTGVQSMVSWGVFQIVNSSILNAWFEGVNVFKLATVAKCSAFQVPGWCTPNNQNLECGMMGTFCTTWKPCFAL